MYWNAHMPAVCIPHHMVAASDPFQFSATLAQRLDDVLSREPDRHQAASPTVTAISLVSSSGTCPALNSARMPSPRSSSASASVSPTPKAPRFPGRPTACTPPSSPARSASTTPPPPPAGTSRQPDRGASTPAATANPDHTGAGPCRPGSAQDRRASRTGPGRSRSCGSAPVQPEDDLDGHPLMVDGGHAFIQAIVEHGHPLVCDLFVCSAHACNHASAGRTAAISPSSAKAPPAPGAKAHGIGRCPPAAREVSLLSWRAGGGLRRRRTRRRPVRLCPW